MTRSSSSSEEDLSMFQAVAVSAEDIAESARKEAESKARRRSSGAGPRGAQQPAAAASAAAAGTAALAGDAAAGSATAHHDAHGQDDNGELDITSQRIAAALNSILAKQLEDATVAAPTVATPAADAGIKEEQVEEEDLAGVRLFRRVAPGTPCVIRESEYGQQQHGAADPDLVHLHPGCERKRVRDVIPRLNLAAASESSKKRHARVLQELAVDGAALLAAAAAADTAWTPHLQQQQDSKTKASPAGKQGKEKKQKVEGVVVEAKQFVPHHERMVKLLGAAAAVGNSAAAAATTAAS